MAAQTAGTAATGQNRKPLTYRQLFSGCESNGEAAKAEAIIQAYLKLRKHFEKMPVEEHMTSWPEILMELTETELVKALEAARREEYCPTAGKLWGFAAADRAEILSDAWTALWNDFLRLLERHKVEWKTALRRSNPGVLPAEYHEQPPPVLDAGLEAAIERAFGCKIRDARAIIWREHPHFGQNDTREPSLVAQRLEERVKAVWMRSGRP